MDDKKTGGAAFPDPGRAQSAKQRELLTDKGMSLRDYFANTAMAALIGKWDGENGGKVKPVLCQAAYSFADAMLAERAK